MTRPEDGPTWHDAPGWEAPSGSARAWVLGAAALAVAVAVVVGVVAVVAVRAAPAAPQPVAAPVAVGTTSATTTPTVPRTTTTPAPVPLATTTSGQGRLPAITVGPIVDGGGGSTVPVQKWADDVAAGDTAALIRKCWTVAPSRIRAQWTGSGRSELLVALSGEAHVVIPGGVLWRTASTSVLVTFQELDSSYACPVVGNGDQSVAALTEDDIRLIVDRYLGRAEGNPVDPGDLAEDYQLTCDVGPDTPSTDPGLPSTVVGGQITSHQVRSVSSRPDVSGTSSVQVDVTTRSGTTGLTVDVKSTPRLPCISAVRR